ncbi:helix-turn-helix domain-containing protein [Vibrio sp. MA40-2]|uniref:helix-turn-helix domain-containing protein n=1 Tax=Vibrio sp. MA40-2 TaxID=3391828 RepID=UPI0039A5FA54
MNQLGTQPIMATGDVRIQRTLAFIHQNISESISLTEIATHSCWSRWQLQRVFQRLTGTSVASYVRELRLSNAAERLLDSSDKIIDIAFDHGFNSEISFSRAFKQMFHISPRAYRQAKRRTGLRKPLHYPTCSLQYARCTSALVDVRINSEDAFTLLGISDEITGIFASDPNFHQRIPEIWASFNQWIDCRRVDHLGVFDMLSNNQSKIKYWAGIELGKLAMHADNQAMERMQLLNIPSQTYAVIRHSGPLDELASSIEWVLLHWLPSSGYIAIDGYEIEKYPADFDSNSNEQVVEYWLPIQAC